MATEAQHSQQPAQRLYELSKHKMVHWIHSVYQIIYIYDYLHGYDANTITLLTITSTEHCTIYVILQPVELAMLLIIVPIIINSFLLKDPTLVDYVSFNATEINCGITEY
eukprot:49296_1